MIETSPVGPALPVIVIRQSRYDQVMRFVRYSPHKAQPRTRVATAFKSLLVMSIVVVMSGCAERFARDPQDLCDYLASRSNWFHALEMSSQKWQVSQSLILAFIQHESLFDAEARPPRRKILWVIPGPRRSSAYGYAQAIDATWAAYKAATENRKAKRDNFADASDFIGWYVSTNAKITKIDRADTYQQYLIYHEGAGGFRRGSHKAKKWLLKVASRVRAKE